MRYNPALNTDAKGLRSFHSLHPFAPVSLMLHESPSGRRGEVLFPIAQIMPNPASGAGLPCNHAFKRTVRQDGRSLFFSDLPLNSVLCGSIENIGADVAIPTSRTRVRAEIEINEEKCTGCGLCVSVCKDFSLKIENKKVGTGLRPLKMFSSGLKLC